MTTAIRPPFEVWRLGEGDQVRIPGHFPEVVTVTGSDYGGTAHDRISWESGPARGVVTLPKHMPVELLATQDPQKRPWLPGADPFTAGEREAIEALRAHLASGAPGEPLAQPCPRCPELRCRGCGFCPCDGRRWQVPALIDTSLCTHPRRAAR